MSLSLRKSVQQLPVDLPEGEPLFLMPVSEANKYDERCVTYAWLGRRDLFGAVYRRLLPDYFEAMPKDSGVIIDCFVPSAKIMPGLTFPGDIDVLVIPYEGNELMLSYTLAIEIKVVRASFARQGKSPNQFGFSQAQALLAVGFPHVAVGHLIISDGSPTNAWRNVKMTTIIEPESCACGPLQDLKQDMLPSDLLRRSHGRLKSRCPDPLLGHFSAYPVSSGLWFPEGYPATLNPRANGEILDGVYAYYQENPQYFLRTRRYPASERAPQPNQERWKHMIEKMRRDFP